MSQDHHEQLVLVCYDLLNPIDQAVEREGDGGQASDEDGVGLADATSETFGVWSTCMDVEAVAGLVVAENRNGYLPT